VRGQRLQSHLGCCNGREEAVLLEVASPLEATTTVKEEEAAANEAKRTDRPELTIFTDGSRLENGATGYAVAWKKGQTWKGHKTHMGWGQEAYDAECAALARALQVVATRNHTLGLVTILTAAIGRMTSDEPGPGQKYALEAKQHIATLRAKEPNVKVEIRWCRSHQGFEGNEIADNGPSSRQTNRMPTGVEWFSTTNLDGTVSERVFPLPRSFANVKRGFSERRWQGRCLQINFRVGRFVRTAGVWIGSFTSFMASVYREDLLPWRCCIQSTKILTSILNYSDSW